jgi:ankyrin repeat domain-containing protein 50
MASLLKQLVQDCPVISDNVKSFYHSHKKQSTYPTLDQFTTALLVEVKTYAKVFIVVDALDECTETDRSRIKLLRALRSLPVNLMVTSRDIPSIEEQFPDAQRLHIRASDHDVKHYVQSQLVDYPSLANLRDIIIKNVVDNAKGM